MSAGSAAPARGGTVHAPTVEWAWGGGALIGSAVLPLVVWTAMPGEPLSVAADWAGMAAFAAALLLFAWGWRGQGSAVARRVPGVVALTVLALWRPVTRVVISAWPASDEFTSFLFSFTYVDMVVWVGAGLAAVVAIGRARVAPPPWCWAPLWALSVVVGLQALLLVVGVAVGARPGGVELYTGLLSVAQLAATVAPVLLGILAIVLGVGAASRPPASRHPVQVYPPRS